MKFGLVGERSDVIGAQVGAPNVRVVVVWIVAHEARDGQPILGRGQVSTVILLVAHLVVPAEELGVEGFGGIKISGE